MNEYYYLDDADAVEMIDDEPEVPSIVYGVVTDCLSLYIREEPDSDAATIGTIKCLTEVMIDYEGSTDEFYKICTAAGVEGYCMKKFVTIRQ